MFIILKIKIIILARVHKYENQKNQKNQIKKIKNQIKKIKKIKKSKKSKKKGSFRLKLFFYLYFKMYICIFEYI